MEVAFYSDHHRGNIMSDSTDYLSGLSDLPVQQQAERAEQES